MTASHEIMAELQAVGGVIARAEAGLAAGALFDLAPLEGLIEDLCHRIEGLSAAEGRRVQPELLALVDDFGRLGRAIESKMAELKAEMGDAAGRRAAVSAYSKSSATRK
jgi:hypothetical protein